MLLKNKLLISIVSFGVVSAAAGGVYYFQKDKKSVVSTEEQIVKKITDNKVPSLSQTEEPVVPKVQALPSSSISDEAKGKTLDLCEQHAIDHPRPPSTENNKKAQVSSADDWFI